MDLRRVLMQLLGIPSARCALCAEKRGELDIGELVVEKWLYTAEPGSRIPATLYRPKPVDGRLPAMVLTCGHGSSKSVVHMSMVARSWARAGVACLLADPLGEEERHVEGLMGTRAHDAPDVAYRTELAGRSVMGKMVFDAMRGLDFLEALDWVDGARLGAGGNSLGGAVAAWLFALEPRLRMTIVSGWAFSDVLSCRHGKHCTRVPNQKLRAVCEWEDFLRLGAGHGALLVLNGDADTIIDPDRDRTVWRDTAAHLKAVDPDGRRLQAWWCAGGGHRPYHGSKRALAFIHEQLGTSPATAAAIAALPELHYGAWCDRNGVALEPLYGVELHYRGAILPDFGFSPMPREQLAVLQPDEVGTADFTIDGWLAACQQHERDS